MPTINACCKFATKFKPDLLIHLGDNWDLAALRGGASETDQQVPLKPDIEAGKDTLNRFFGSYAQAHKVYLWGNHEMQRINRHIKSHRAIVSEYATDLRDELVAHVKRLVDEQFEYGKRSVFEYEGMVFLHGVAHGMYAAKSHAISYGNCLFGHIHCDSSYVLEDMSQSKAQSSPCSCALDMDYNAAHKVTLRQEQGFVYGQLCEDIGLIDIHVCKKASDGKFYYL